MNILGEQTQSVAGAQDWARSRGATDLFISLAPLYWHFAPERGVRPEVAYAQCAKETGFCRFGGVIDATYRNPCGLKTREGGSNTDPNAHQRFPTWDVGVQAHLDHLALYAGALGYPRPGSPDPRHFDFILGKATTVEALGGTWAPSDTYGTSLRDNFVMPMVLSPTPPEVVAATVEQLQKLDDALGQAIAEVAADLTALPTQADTVSVAMDELEARLHDAVTRFLA